MFFSPKEKQMVKKSIQEQRKIAQARAERLEEREYSPEEEKQIQKMANEWVMNLIRKPLINALDLNFSKYDYYDDHCHIYRYSKQKKTSEIFNKETMKWELSDINIREYLLYWWDPWDWDPLDPNRDDTSFPKTKEELLKGYLNLTQQEINEYEWQEHKKALEKQIKEYLNKGKSVPSKLFITVVGDCPDTTMARKIIPLQKNINAKDENGQTALHRCAMSAGTGVIKTIKLLIKYGANLNAKDDDGNRPVDCVFPEAWDGDTKNMNKAIELLTPISIKKNKSLVEQYQELAMLGDENISKTKEDKICQEMDKIKKRFKEKDWDKLIHSVPVFMRPMVAEQKKKYLGKK